MENGKPIMTKKNDPKKAKKHESKGDELLAKGKLKKAFEQFQKALENDPDNPDIYDKLIRARNEMPDDWKLDDFADSVSWTMKKQELENPPIRQVHAKLSPEWKKATELIFRLLNTDDEDKEKELIEELVTMGEPATRALVGFVLEIKKNVKSE